MFEFGLRTISTAQEATERWFFCAWNPVPRVFSILILPKLIHQWIAASRHCHFCRQVP